MPCPDCKVKIWADSNFPLSGAKNRDDMIHRLHEDRQKIAQSCNVVNAENVAIYQGNALEKGEGINQDHDQDQDRMIETKSIDLLQNHTLIHVRAVLLEGPKRNMMIRQKSSSVKDHDQKVM